MVNAELFLNQDKLDAQGRILTLLLKRQTYQLQSEVLERFFSLSRRNTNKEGVSIFNRYYLLRLLNLVLNNYEIKDHDDTNPNHELNFLKSYLIVAQEANEGFELDQDTYSQTDWFRKNTWPIALIQVEANKPLNPISTMIKGQVLFNHLLHNSCYSEQTKEFLKSRNIIHAHNYILGICHLIGAAFKKPEKSTFYPFSIEKTETLSFFLESFSVNIQGFRNHDKSNDFYRAIKETPLFPFDEKSLLVLDWNLFGNKLYQGLLFDIYKNSKISEVPKFKSFLKFKDYTSLEVIEKTLLKNIVLSLFDKKHGDVKFDDSNKEGFPDAYVRVGKRIFLFEIKDSFFKSEAIFSRDYKTIKEEIDKKYNSQNPKPRGVFQLLNSISRLNDGQLDTAIFHDIGIKQRNTIIYPILIFTDINFSAPGIARYLTEEFDKQIDNTSFSKSFQQVKPLSFIGLDFLLENLDLLSKPRTSFQECLEYYFIQMKKRIKNLDKRYKDQDIFLANEPFEQVVIDFLENDQIRNYTEFMFDKFELGNGLTNHENN